MGTSKAWSVILAGLFGLCLAAPVLAQQTATLTHAVAQPSVAPSDSKAPACSPLAMRQAVDRKQAPAVTGCRYDDVSASLMSLHILPLPTPVYSDAASGVIVTQKPAAGTPAKSQLLLVEVSRGQKPPTKPSPAASSSESLSASSSASSESQMSVSPSKSASPSSVTSTASASAPSSSASAPSSASASSVAAKASTDEGPGLNEIAGLLWSAIAAYPLPAVIAVGLAALLTGLGLRRKPPKISVTPRVRCDLEPGPSRLILSGPLVIGRKGDA